MRRVIQKVRGQKTSYNIKSINLITTKLIFFTKQSQKKPPSLQKSCCCVGSRYIFRNIKRYKTYSKFYFAINKKIRRLLLLNIKQPINKLVKNCEKLEVTRCRNMNSNRNSWDSIKQAKVPYFLCGPLIRIENINERCKKWLSPSSSNSGMLISLIHHLFNSGNNF